jgi:hypothetical protein
LGIGVPYREGLALDAEAYDAQRQNVEQYSAHFSFD